MAIHEWLGKILYLTLMLIKRLDAADHRYQRSMLGISWKDRIMSKDVRARTGQQSMDNVEKGRRLCRLEHMK